MAIRLPGFQGSKNGALRPWIQHITVNAAQLQPKIAFDVDFEKARQQSCTDHLLERFASLNKSATNIPSECRIVSIAGIMR